MDDAPHHVRYAVSTHPLDSYAVDTSTSRHIDCCAEEGCPICATDVRRANADGVEIHTFVRNRPEDHQEILLQNFGVQSPGHTKEE